MDYKDVYEQFCKLTSVYPSQRYTINNIIDLFSPIGYGQRCLVVAPPKVGKTTLLKSMAQKLNGQGTELNILLVGERPEEVTDFAESVANCTVYCSTFNDSGSTHIDTARQCLQDSMEAVLSGKDVVILMDSITRLTRASNLTVNTGKTLSGGIDAAAFEFPKEFFGAAGCYKEGGSLTIIATCLVDTGSKMDDVIFEEFKGTGNSEIVLERKTAEQGIYPAINLTKSGTRNDHLLLSSLEMKSAMTCKRILADLKGFELNNEIINRLSSAASIESFCGSLNPNY